MFTKISEFFKNMMLFYFITCIFSINYCSIVLKRHSEHSSFRPDASSLVIVMMYKLDSDQRFFFQFAKFVQKQIPSKSTSFQSNLNIGELLSTLGEGIWMWVLLATVELYSMRCNFPVVME